MNNNAKGICQKNSNFQQGENINQTNNDIYNINKKTAIITVCVVILIISFVLSLSAFITVVCVKMDYSLEFVSTSIALSFIGTLATFVVVSNYAQVNDIQQNLTKELDDLKQSFKVDIAKTTHNTDKYKSDTESMIEALNKRIELLAISNISTLTASTYKILGIDHNDTVENWYVLVINIPIERKSLTLFTKRFRDEYCKKESNINLIDNPDIYPLITKYPLINGEDYIKVADHFVAMKVFDMEDLWMYPFQDSQYKEFGGSNWKK